MYLTLPISILVHIAVGNYTKMTTNFLDLNSNYILKVFILLLLVLGLKGIKFVHGSNWYLQFQITVDRLSIPVIVC